MRFSMPAYHAPDFSLSALLNAPNALVSVVASDGIAPENFHATSIFPEYFKIGGRWRLLDESRMDCVVVVSADGRLDAREIRRLRVGDQVVTGRKEDGTEGIFVHPDGFRDLHSGDPGHFSFRSGRSRETAYSRDYDRLYDLLQYEKEHGHVVWVLGPAVVFDSDSKHAMMSLIRHGYVHAILGGNAVAVHDLEGTAYRTALGQDIYTQQGHPDGHYHHLDIINHARRFGSLAECVKTMSLQDSVLGTCIEKKIPFVAAGSIRDDGPLPGVISDVYAAQDAMRLHTKKATTVICLATQLHSIAVGNMTPAYQSSQGSVRPVFIYIVDVSEFALNKLRDRGSLEVTTIVTNVQDFLVNLARNLVP